MLHDAQTPASRQDGRYPRPQLVRSRWLDLTGQWGFRFDPADAGLREGWVARPESIDGTITVPFPPESPASGVADPGYHRVLWYRRTVTSQEVLDAGHRDGDRLLIHFGAVDFQADVWVSGRHVAHHRGGHTPFTAEALDVAEGFDLVVRVEDDPADLAQPRGKQDWAPERHVVWYDRTSGIWQPVWLEAVPRQHVTALRWQPDVAAAAVSLTVELAELPADGTRLEIALTKDAVPVAELAISTAERSVTATVALPPLRNGQALDDWLWSPERPTLIDATITLRPPDREPDRIRSYFGLRSVGEDDGRFLLNGRPCFLRGVLSQGYWPTSHLAAPSADALRAEAQLIKDLGFTMVRVHQKIEDPRFLYWADRLGLLVWAEMPSAYEFSDTAVARLVSEWIEVVRRDCSHPSIVVWVPFNESWGVHHLADDERQRDLLRTLYHLTKAMDPERLVVSNDGWEHTRSDLFTIHDYENDAGRLRARYATPEAAARSMHGVAVNGKRMLVGTPEEAAATAARPVVLSEFGGVSVEPNDSDGWGYRLVESHDHLEEHLAALFAAVHGSSGLAGWCYTQLTDTAQETNGLADENRIPKLPLERLRAIVEGTRPAGLAASVPLPAPMA